MLYIDVNYARRVGVQMRNWKEKGNNLFNFSCPICGDSEKNKRKARAYIYPKKNNLFFKCHNCDFGCNLTNFLKRVDPTLHSEYVLENYKEGGHHKNTNIPKPDDTLKQYFETAVKPTFNAYVGLPTINDVPKENMAREVCVARKIPEQYWSKLFYAADWKQWVDEKFTGYDTFISEPRLVIPFYDRNGKMIMAQGRSLMKSKMKYLTVRLDEESPKVFGLERWDPEQHTYVVEGPIDSLFLPNCLAVAGADLGKLRNLNKKSTTLIFDNEPRNPITVKKISQAIDNGWIVFIPPKGYVDKDLNEAIQSGMNPGSLKLFVDSWSKSGLQAKLNLTQWSL
tara:strand:+ start:978 stop:1994 length:1017 start_codon:yes stop_codon:yes gene_type:complete